MILDTAAAFASGNQGLTIFQRPDDFMVSVKGPLGGFVIGYGPTPADALADALNPAPRPAPGPCADAALFGDLL